MVNLVRYPKETEPLSIGAPRAADGGFVIFRIGHLGRIESFTTFCTSSLPCPVSTIHMPDFTASSPRLGELLQYGSLRGPLTVAALSPRKLSQI